MLLKDIIVIIAERRFKKRDMKFKKIISVLASAVMLSSTIGFAAAAAYPEPFVTGGTADGAVIVGANAAVSDWSAAIDMQKNLQGLVTTGGTSTSVSGTAWQVETSSDSLELNETFQEVETYIGSSELPILADGTISNEKGDAKYSQYLYFTDLMGGNVNYQEDDDDNVGLFLRFDSGTVIARYVMDFTTTFDSDSVANTLEDIEDEEISILGKTYTITTATNASNGAVLTLMSGANKATISNDEEITLDGRTISVVVSAANVAKFTVDGETLNKMGDGETTKLSDGTYLGISDITYQEFAGGLMQATFYLGADKIKLENGASLEVNAESISDAKVTISTSNASGDVQISEIAVNITAEDDLYVPEGGKLSEATDLDEPQALLTQNWDIEFKGLDTYKTEDISITSSASDKRFELKFKNYDGNEITLPLIFSNTTGIHGGKDNSDRFVLDPASGMINISKDDYFILNTADPVTVANDARSFVLQYKGADKVTDTDPKAKFNIIGVDSSREATLSSTGTFDLKLGGSTFSFNNATTMESNDADIILTSTDYADYGTNSLTTSNYLRTQYNALINITNLNYTLTEGAADFNWPGWSIEVTIDDTDRDGDKYAVGTASRVIYILFKNDSDGDIQTTPTYETGGISEVSDNSWVTDTENSDISTFRTIYGVFGKNVDTSTAPAQVTLEIPDSIVKPLVYVTSGEVTVTPGGTGAGGQVLVVKDSEVSSVSGKNLVVVGGSCINTVAAKILGSDTPMCTEAFTTATDVGAGQYIIKTVASPYAAADSGKVAMLVAGYNAADTTNAVAKALEGVTSDVDTEQIYPMTTA